MIADGKIFCKGKSLKISGKEAQKKVHELINRCRGIMVGINTVLTDNPLLNCRIENGRSPIRIIIDSKLNLPLASTITQTAFSYKTIVACALEQMDPLFIAKKNILEQRGVHIVSFPEKSGRVHLPTLLDYLASQEIDGILLEGGAELNSSMLQSGLVQELKFFLSPAIYGNQGLSPIALLPEKFTFPNLTLNSTERCGQDILASYTVAVEAYSEDRGMSFR